MKKLILLASMLAFTATAQSLQDRVSALETQVFGKPSVAARPAPAPRVDTEASLKAKADRLAAREERMKANPVLAAKLKSNEERRAAALAAREDRLKAVGGSRPLVPGQPATPGKPK
jgi:hypothetical protein